MLENRVKALATLAVTMSCAVASHAAPLNPNNVVVYRVGDGAAAIGNTAAAVFLDEYTRTGTLVQSIALPTVASGSNNILTANGNSTSEGLLNRSADGRYLLLTGYSADLGTAAPSNAQTLSRVVGRVDAAGAINTSTLINYGFGGNNIRGAISSNGTDIYVGGSASDPSVGGIFYTTLGSTTGTNITTVPVRGLSIANGQLFASSTSNSAPGVLFSVGSGLPTSGPAALSALPGTPTAGTGSTNQFALLDLSSSVAGPDTLYVAADTGAAITKFSLVGGNWVADGKVGGGSDDYTGLTAVEQGGVVSLFATRLLGDSPDELVLLTDASGYHGSINGLTPSIIATAANNTGFRGVALAPVPEPTSLLLVLAPAAMLGLRRRRA